MPEHIHLLISEPEKGDPSKVMQAMKQGFARRVLGERRKRRLESQLELFSQGSDHVWQHRFYDFNVWSARKRIEKLRYMHRNPVQRGLVSEPEPWRWSSKLCLRRSGRRTNQPVGAGGYYSASRGSVSPELISDSHPCQERKGGAPPAGTMPSKNTGTVGHPPTQVFFCLSGEISTDRMLMLFPVPNAPLKPKPGLSGPPGREFSLQGRAGPQSVIQEKRPHRWGHRKEACWREIREGDSRHRSAERNASTGKVESNGTRVT